MALPVRIIAYQKCTHTLLAIGLSFRRVLFKPFIAALSNKRVTEKNSYPKSIVKLGTCLAATALFMQYKWDPCVFCHTASNFPTFFIILLFPLVPAPSPRECIRWARSVTFLLAEMEIHPDSSVFLSCTAASHILNSERELSADSGF